MQTASAMVALAGDAGQTVPVYEITPSELAVLQFIHGNDAVSEIVILGDVERTDRAERQRLYEKFGRSQEGRLVCPAVDTLFPGAAARLFQTFAELDVDDVFFKTPPAKADEQEEKPKAKTPRKAVAATPAPEPEIEDMPADASVLG